MCAGTHIDISPRRNYSTTKQISTTKFYKQRHLPRCRYQRTTRDIAIILGSNKVLTNLNTKIKENGTVSGHKMTENQAELDASEKQAVCLDVLSLKRQNQLHTT